MTDHHQRKKYLLVTMPVILLLLLDSTSLVVDAEGQATSVVPLTRSRYDPFGDGRRVRVAETQIWQDDSWESLDPTQAITQTDYLYPGASSAPGDYLERELNIYFTVDGRYYDPWLGKYLQPDAIGGPPLIPQAADRYQYAGNSPTGVGEINQSNEFVGWASSQAVKVALSKQWEGFYGPLLGRAIRGFTAQPTGKLLIQIQAEKTLIRRYLSRQVLDQLTLISSQRPGFSLRPRSLWRWGASFLTDRYNVETYTGWVHQADVRLSLSQADELGLQVLGRETVNVFSIGWKGIAAELAGSAFLDVAFQVGQDWGNPYLTPAQKWERAGWAGVGGLASGSAGLALEAGLIYFGVASGPAGWVVIVLPVAVALAVDATWTFGITPMIYESRGLNEELRLRPLQGGTP